MRGTTSVLNLASRMAFHADGSKNGSVCIINYNRNQSGNIVILLSRIIGGKTMNGTTGTCFDPRKSDSHRSVRIHAVKNFRLGITSIRNGAWSIFFCSVYPDHVHHDRVLILFGYIIVF